MGKKYPSFQEFLDIQRKQQPEKVNYQSPITRLGVVAGTYDFTAALVPVIFDGDSVARSIVAGTPCNIGDRVLAMSVGNTWEVVANANQAKNPGCVLMDTSGQGLAAAADAVILFETEVSDPYNFHSTVSNTGRITPTIPGVYTFNGVFAVPSRSGGYSLLSCIIRKNGNDIMLTRLDFAGSGGSKQIPISVTEYANGTTDYFELVGHQENASNVAVTLPNASGSLGARFECNYQRAVW